MSVSDVLIVEDEVLKTSKKAASSAETSSEEMRKFLENLGDEDLGRWKM